MVATVRTTRCCVVACPETKRVLVVRVTQSPNAKTPLADIMPPCACRFYTYPRFRLSIPGRPVRPRSIAFSLDNNC